MDLDPQAIELTVRLTEVAARNTASFVTDKVGAARRRKKNEDTIHLLEELVNDLLADKSELVQIARSYEEEVIAQRISDEDIEYITTSIIPLIRSLSDASDGEDKFTSLAKDLLSKESIKILQLIGFNFRRGIGEPLTELVAELISSKSPVKKSGGNKGPSNKKR